MNRPTHDDFQKIAAGVRLNDIEASERSIQEVVSEMADYESVEYIAVERSKHAVFADNPLAAVLYTLGHPDVLVILAQMGANWMDGFAAGVKFSSSSPPASSREMANRVPAALSLIEGAVHTDGAHHLQWYLNEIAKKLTGPQYEVWRDGVADRNEGIDYDEGMAP